MRAAPPQMPPHLESYPGIVFLIDIESRILSSNNVGREVAGNATAFENLLDDGSRTKWQMVTQSHDRPCTAELLITAQPLRLRSFFVSAQVDGTRMLIELPQDDGVERLHDNLTQLNSELINTQREVSKQKAQLEHALAALRESMDEKEKLGEELQAHSEELEAQNEELLAITEELRERQNESQRLNAALEHRTAELQRVMRSRERFFSAMSHELRTPLTAVLGYDHLLLDGVAGELNEQQRNFIERTRAAAQHLNSLLDDILDLAKLESGTLELSLDQTAIASLLTEIVDTLRPSADAAGSALHLDVAGAPGAITSDVRALRQILLNLMSNALKFGAGHPVTVRCTRRGDYFTVDVSDRGVGVDPADAERIFEEFGQAEAGRQMKGTGLGLAISRQLAERLGGTLELLPSAVGATFRLSLPVAGPPS